MLIDTHCHLFMEPLVRDVPAVLSRAHQTGVTQVVVPAYDSASWAMVRNLTQHEGVHSALGLHPWAAHETLDLAALRDALAATKAVAIGEIGLDFKIPEPGRSRQIHTLTAQLRLALELDLPVILHCRGAFEEMLQIIGDDSPGLRGVLHAYSRGPELAQRFVDLGLSVAFGGAITRPRAKRAQRSAAILPSETILLETDAPSIGLEGVQPEQTEPRHVAQVARMLADIRGTTLAEIASVTTRNAQQLFGI